MLVLIYFQNFLSCFQKASKNPVNPLEVSKNFTSPKLAPFQFSNVNIQCGYKLRRYHVSRDYFNKFTITNS